MQYNKSLLVYFKEIFLIFINKLKYFLKIAFAINISPVSLFEINYPSVGLFIEIHSLVFSFIYKWKDCKQLESFPESTSL